MTQQAVEAAVDHVVAMLAELGHERFRGHLEARDLRLAATCVRRLMTSYHEPIPDNAKVVVEVVQAVAMAGFLEAKYAAQVQRAEIMVEQTRALLDQSARADMAGVKTTEAMVAAFIERAPDYARVKQGVIDVRELATLLRELKFSLIRLHDSLIELSRDERVLLREKD